VVLAVVIVRRSRAETPNSARELRESIDYCAIRMIRDDDYVTLQQGDYVIMAAL